ncbi:MAG: putative transposase [Mucilaginibacter sp.]|nr:putative transposase [Mucilaginibacter sp.]
MRTEQLWGIRLSLLCLLSGYTRQAYYKKRIYKQQGQFQQELVVQQVMNYRKVQKRIGSRKLLLLLCPFMKQHQIKIGRDCFFDLLRICGLLIGRKRGKPRTTFSGHWLRKHPNLIKDLTPVIAGGLWVSDITYIELYQGNSYLSLVTDAYSRKIVGFHLSERLSAAGCITALEMAVTGCAETKGLIHHSDRGVQYCCSDYIEILQKQEISISMTQSGDPRDNAIAERVNGILKTELLEEVFTDIDTARAAVAQAVNAYNYLRPHSSIDMLTPAIAHSRRGELKRRWKNYYQSKIKTEEVMDG